MINLDDVEQLKKLDSANVISSVENLGQQIRQAWTEAAQVQIPDDYKQAKNILVAGMGGSTLGADVLRNLFKDNLSVPIIVNNHYQLPSFINSDSLVILSSYSGTTEEVLAAANEAKSRSAKIVGIAEGNALGEFLKTNGYPSYIFEPKYNPSKQPRLGVGYTFSGTLALLVQVGFIKISEGEVIKAVEELEQFASPLKPEIGEGENKAKALAKQLFNHLVFITAAEHLSGNAHIFANQTNESAKNFASYFVIPELNHHLLEGMTNPESLKQEVKFVFLESLLYSAKIQKRLAITKDVLDKQQIKHVSINFDSNSKLTQTFEALVMSSWTTFYLGVLNGADPAKIPWVDYFKEQLAKEN